MTYKEIQCFEGALSGTEAIGIMVARSKKRFTKCAVNRAKRAKESAGYNIILTDEDNIYSDLIEYIESNRLDSSDNKKLKEELEETRSEVRQLRSEIAELRHLLVSLSK